MFGGILNNEARFFADGYELSGVENVSLSYGNSSTITKPLGTKKGLTTSSGPTQKTLSLSRVLTYDDPILNYTGESPLSGSVYYSDGHYGFESGYLVDYSLNCAVGAVPRVSCNFQIASEIKSGVDGNTSPQSHPVIDIPTQGSISITCDNSTTNRVVGFDYGVKLNRKAYITVGNNNVVKVELLQPLEYTATVQVEVDDAFLQDSNDFFEAKENKTVSLNIQGRNGGQIQSVDIPNASLVGESLNVSADGLARITLNYIGHTSIYEDGFDAGLTYVFNEDGSVADTEPNDIENGWKDNLEPAYGLHVGTEVDIIGNSAFKNRTTLAGDLFIESPSQVLFSAFEGCTGLNNDLVLGGGITDIGDNAFKNCNFLGALVFPESFNNMGISAFEGCSRFDGILKLPINGMSTLGNNAFKNCSKLNGNLNLPNINSNIVPDSIFENCFGFDGSISIGGDYVEIGTNSFKNCNRLNGRLEIPGGVTTINSGAFENCSSLDGKLNFEGLPSLSSIGQNSFKGCIQLSDTLSIPAPVTNIEEGAFENCKGIQKLVFDGSVCSNIGDRAFKDCVSLGQGLQFKNSNFSLGEEAFKNCSSLNAEIKGLSLANNIGSGVFENCNNLYGDLKVCGANGKTISTSAFKNSYAGGLTLDTSSAQYIGEEAFRNTNFQNFIDGFIENALTISGRAFQDCNASYYITEDNFINPNLQKIGEKAFKNSKGLSGTILFNDEGYSLNHIGNEAFYGCENIRDVITHIPPDYFKGQNTLFNIRGCLYASKNVYDDYESLLTDGIFQGMPLCRGASYTRVYNSSYQIIAEEESETINNTWYSNQTTPTPQYLDIGLNVTSIGQQAFLNSTALFGFLTIPKSVNSIGLQAFKNTNFDGELIIENGVETIGLEAFEGTDFVGDLTIPSSVTQIGSKAFKNCSNFDGSLIIEANAATIGDNAFENCSSLTGGLLMNNVSGIGLSSFEGCSSLNGELIIPNVTNIAAGAFSNCSNIVGELDLFSVTGVLGDNAFLNCGSLESLLLSQRLTSIGQSAFKNCKDIEGSITLFESLSGVGESVGFEAFKNCSGIEVVYTEIPESNIGAGALQFQSNTTSDKILYARDNVFAEYVNQLLEPGYYQGNLVQLWRLDDAPTVIFNDVSDEIASYTGDIPAEWRDGSNPNDKTLIFGSSVTTIGTKAFYDNKNLEGLLFFPGSIKNINEQAFSAAAGRTKYSSFIFSEGLETIGNAAFQYSDITSLKLPSSLFSIGTLAFADAGAVKNITIGKDDGSHRTIIGNEAFIQNTLPNAGLGSVTIRSSVGRLGEYAFGSPIDKDWLGSLDIGCQTIDVGAFKSKEKLTNITFKDSVKYIERESFYNCTGLKYVNIPDPLRIGKDRTPDNAISAFGGCYLTGLVIGNDTKNTQGVIEYEAFRSTNFRTLDGNLLGDIDSNCKVKIGSSIETIKNYAFSDNFNGGAGRDAYWMSDLHINSKNIGLKSFYKQTNLTGVKFGSVVTNIDKWAFRSCDKLTGVKFGSGVTNIGEEAFRLCDIAGEISIPIPGNIGVFAFRTNDSTKEILLTLGTNGGSTVGNIGRKAFKGSFGNNAVDYYNDRISNKKKTVVIHDSIDLVDFEAFIGRNFGSTADQKWITHLDINCARIGKKAFEKNYFTDIKWGPNISYVGDQAFAKCHTTGDVILTKKDCTVFKIAFSNVESALHNNIRNFYVNSKLRKSTSSLDGFLTIEDLAPKSYQFMTGDFYVHADYYDQWTGIIGSTKLNTSKVGGSNILPWNTYPNPI